MKHAKKRMKCIVMNEHEAMLHCEAPNAARGNEHPAYPMHGYED